MNDPTSTPQEVEAAKEYKTAAKAARSAGKKFRKDVGDVMDLAHGLAIGGHAAVSPGTGIGHGLLTYYDKKKGRNKGTGVDHGIKNVIEDIGTVMNSSFSLGEGSRTAAREKLSDKQKDQLAQMEADRPDFLTNAMTEKDDLRKKFPAVYKADD